MKLPNKPVRKLSRKTRKVLDAILLTCRDGMTPFLSERDYLESCYALIDAGLAKVYQDGDSFSFGPTPLALATVNAGQETLQ